MPSTSRAPSASSHSTPTHFLQPSTSSPTPVRSAMPSAASSTTSLPGSSSTNSLVPAAGAMTVDMILAQHAAAPDPKMSALEQALNDRNVLSSQNAQLWKLIEKQRSGYNQILKELERVRAERDSAKSKLGAVLNSSDRRHRSHDKAQPNHGSQQSHASPVPPSEIAATNSDHPRQTMIRHHSEEQPTPRTTAHALHSTQSLEPTTSHSRVPPPSVPDPSQAHTTTPRKSSLSPLVVPPRAESLPVPAISDTQEMTPFPPQPHHTYSDSITSGSSHASRPATYSRKSSITESVASVSTTGTSVSYSQTPPPQSNYHHSSSHSASTPQTAPPDFSSPSVQNSTPQQTFSSSPMPNPYSPPPQLALLSVNGAHQLSRDSRISLPDEARQYIANMVDSPAPSPKVGAFAASKSPLAAASINTVNGRESPQIVIKGEFLDFDDDGDDDDDVDDAEDHDADNVGELPSDPTEQLEEPLSPTTSQARKNKPRAAVEDFPLPPSNVHAQQAHAAAQARTATSTSSHHRAGGYDYPDDQQLHSSPADSLASIQPRTEMDMQESPNVPASFRALPLLSSDLPHTTINVSHSFVRPTIVERRCFHLLCKKAVLQNYLQTLINLPVKHNDEVIAFFTSDIVRDMNQPVMQAGYKEGYLTKRGKNFGGWKTRYFVLQGPVLEYYDCRGGTHLGSISVTGAQIGRQQRTERSSTTDEEKEYRHAFLIVEAKKGPGGNHPRHVLCAESDADRDGWVEMLVRYFTGKYTEDPLPLPFNSSSGSVPQMNAPVPVRRPVRGLSKDDISVSKGAMPISRLPPDPSNAKLFPATGTDDYVARSASPSKSIQEPSPIDRYPPTGFSDAQTARRILERGQPQSSSLPDSSPLSNATSFLPSERANSEMGHYPDLQEPRTPRASQHPSRQHSPERHRASDRERKSVHPSSGASPAPGYSDRVPSPEKFDANSKVKISGPLNGAPIPSGFKFGSGKDSQPDGSAASASDRREKAKSRSFWGFGRPNGGDKMPSLPNHIPRAVFGVPLEEALDVATIAHLPAIVFRSIQYLEAKQADQEEGIYRLSGSSAVIKNLKDMFNAEGDVDLLASDEYWDPHAVAGLLKSFLRELPASILTRELHLRFLAVIDFVDPQERIRELSHLIASLPIANYSLLRALTAHLILVVQNSSVNKMNMRNVGIVFSPTLGIPAGVFSLMLGEFNRVFNVEETAEEESRRNSKQYSDGAADQLLGLSGRTLKAPPEEAQSDGDDYSVQEESGTENEDSKPDEEDARAHVDLTPPDTPVQANVKMSKASHVASSRGLNVTVTQSERGNRHSRMMGLPVSPRPPPSPVPSGSSSSPPASF
ncbi:RhoGAP-domain-containing protein [Hymenopellis radicata]|nr:RhoGAP-domain-containing protein [Hymenopellis radicata]